MTAITADVRVRPHRSFQEVWVISLGHALTHWYPATFYLLLPLIGKELGLSYSEIGSVLTCQYAAGAIANIPGGIFVDSVGRKGLLMALSLFWIGFPYLLMGFSHAYWMVLCCATLVGIGNNLWHPTAIPWLANRFPQRKGLVTSIHGMGGNVGDAVAPLVIGALLGVLNWRNVVILNVLPGIALSAIMLIYIGRKQNADRDAGIADVQGGGDVGDRAPAHVRRASEEPRADHARGRISFPHHDARRASDFPADLFGPGHGLPDAVDWRLHVRLAGRWLHRRADRGPPLR
jgi:MFS family permease